MTTSMASSKSFEDLDLSQEELKRISDALKDEKFRKMFVEYAEEISNPENRKRYEEEIAMLENEKGMDVQFVNPQPGFVLKTIVDKDGSKKAFINICTSDKLGKPTSKKHTDKGVNGLYWQIPHSFSPPREDNDKSKKICLVYDVVFHPDTLRMASNPRFKKLVEDTAIEGIEKQFDCKLDRNNIRRPNLKFKGQPVATVIRSKMNDGSKQELGANDALKNMPYPYSDKSSEELANENQKKAEQKAKDLKTKAGKTKSNNEKKEEENGFTTPKYTIIHRSNLELQEYTNAPDSKPTTRPKELAISIELPLCRSAAGVDLDIFEDRLVLMSEKPAYKLDIKLPYSCDDENGSAKFDKTRKCLVVTLPVIATEVPKMPSFFDNDKNNMNPAVPSLIEELAPLEKVNEVEEKADEVTQPKPTTTKVSYTLPQYDYNQDEESVTFIFHVKNVDDDSVSKAFPKQQECLIQFMSVGSGGFPMRYGLYAQFSSDVKVVSEHSNVDITDKNMTVTLLKARGCRTMWNKISVGLDENSLEEKFFLTPDSLQSRLEELTLEVDNMGKTDNDVADQATVEVSEMNHKKLTIDIKKARSGNSISEDEDEEGYSDSECPNSADIEVIHSKVTPNLHGILKQRSWSESSEDPSSESPTSTSPRDSDGNRHVKFNSHIDKTTFKTNATVTSMKQALKSKRRQNRKREEKKAKSSSRRRHNSNGSECSSCDDEHDVRHSSESHSEDDHEKEELGQLLQETGQKFDVIGVIPEDKEDDDKSDETVEHKQSSEVKEDGGDNTPKVKGTSKIAAQVKNKMAAMNKPVSGCSDSDDDGEDDQGGQIVDRASVGVSDAGVKHATTTHKDVDRTSLESEGQNGESQDKGNDLSYQGNTAANPGNNKAAKKLDSGKKTPSQLGKNGAIKGDNLSASQERKSVKFDESEVHEKGDNGEGESGKGDNNVEQVEKCDVETELSWKDENRSDPKNVHRTDCAFNFSNAVMFDLDID